MLEPEPILQFFEFEHLPIHLKDISRPFWELAWHIVGVLPRNPERTVALRKLLEAKDAAVRAAIYEANSDQWTPAKTFSVPTEWQAEP